MLILQTISQKQQDKNDKAFLTAKLESFMQKQRNTKFMPEYQYKTFFFNISNTKKATTEENKDARAEQYRIAGEILRASNQTSVVFYTENSNAANSLASGLACPDTKKSKSAPASYLEWQLGQYVLTGRIKFSPSGDTVSLDWWSQDLGEPTGAFVPSGGKSKPEYITSLTGNLYGWRHEIPMKGNASVVQIPACLAGGNFTKTICRGKKLCIVGANDVIETYELYHSVGLEITLNQVKNIYKKAFGADDVLVLGKGSGTIDSWKLQPQSMFHIDQAVFFPKEGVAVLVSPPKGMAEEEEAAKGYKKQLVDAGFEIIEIPTTKERIEKGQAYTNSITISSERGTSLIMPSFGYRDGLEGEIRSILEKHGFKVVFVPDNAFKRRGNAHCMTGALSYSDMVPQFYKQATEGITKPRA